MASFHEICNLLGDGVNPGREGLIESSLKSFSRIWSSMTDIPLVAHFFLAHRGKQLFGRHECRPRIPEHHDEISGLVTQAFRLLRSTPLEEAMPRSLPASPSRKFDYRMPSTNSGSLDNGLTLQEERPRNDHEKKESDAMGLDSVVADLPRPVVAQDKVELVRVLESWIKDHPHQRIPALSNHDKYAFESNFAMEATLAETGERVWICRLGVLDLYQGWVLAKPDGTQLCVKASYIRKEGGHVYFPWVGGDIGFSDEMIAHHQTFPKKSLTLRMFAERNGLDPEKVLNEYDISKWAVNSEAEQDMQAGSDEKVVTNFRDTDSTLSSLSDGRETSVIHWKNQFGNGTKRKKRDISTKHVDDPTRRKRSKLGTTEETASGNFNDALNDLSSLQDTPTEATWTDENTSMMLTPSRGSKPTAGQNMLRTPPSSSRKSSMKIDLATPFEPTRATIPSSNAAPRTPLSRSLRHPPTTFHLYLSNPSLGAIPTPFSTFTSKQKFLKEASAAYSLASNGTEEIIAASVTISGLNRAIVVRKDKAGNPAWEEVGRVVRELEKVGGVEGEVRCIVDGNSR